MNRILNSESGKKLYLTLLTISFVLVSLLNLFPRPAICAFTYVSLALVAILTSELYGTTKAMQNITLAILANSIFLYSGLDIILIGSFISVIASLYFGINLAAKLSNNFHIKAFISLILCSAIDSCLMEIVLLSKFSMNKVLFIFAQDMMFKLSYSLVASACLFVAFYLLGRSAQKH